MKLFNKDNREMTLGAKGRLYGDTFIPEEFENVILRHIILNSISHSDFRPSPILLIQGKKGEGKTFMTNTILDGNNIFFKSISSSVLSGEKEGEAASNLRLYYKNCENDPENGKYTALVIDDFHLSIAISKNTASHTTNADGLIEALMNIADRKEKLKAPIILIGNNFTDAYAPLIRAGRTTICTWEPSLDDKKEIVRRIIMKHKFDPSCIEWENVSNFVEQFKDQYIGFYEKVIENACFQKLLNVTNLFAECKGKVSLDKLTNMIINSSERRQITMKDLYREANNLLEVKVKKFDK